MAGFEAQIFPLSARLAASLRLRPGLQPPKRKESALLRPDPQPPQLCPLGDRQPRIEPRATQWMRWLHRPGVDRHIAHAQYVPRSIPGADFRNSISRIWGDAKYGRFSLPCFGEGGFES